ncbi:MAG: cytochrome c biogenesis protein CcsA [Spirochaetota bacterium]|nr:cytochrome c biogenesis protein CcsA [Spirochaetota bacterium]
MNIGTILIYFTFATSIISIFFLAKSHKGGESDIIKAERLFYLSGISITLTLILLLFAFLTNSFNFNYVYNYSSNDLPLVYKITALWAGQEGTFLLWIFLLFIFGLIIIRSKDENENILLGIIILAQLFILLILCIHGPFEYVWERFPNRFKPNMIPQDGSGLNPLLQDPWMVIHPPVLFVGYASAVIPFGYAIAGLFKNDYKSWINRSYKWILFCMASLGMGIFLGGYWAYKVLGWGGYWGWDPVENSSLIPWLFIVALMHGMNIQKRKGALIKTNLFLAIISFITVLYSTFLTRSGILSDFSVHSFSDLGISIYLILFIVFFLLLGAVLLIKRFSDIESSPLSNKIFTTDNIISYGIITLSFYSLFILIGTSMPILSKVFLSNPTSVKATFYNNISIPLGLLILAFIALSSIFNFSKSINIKGIITISVISLILAILINLQHTHNVFAYTFAVAALFVVLQNIVDLRKYKLRVITSSRLSHIGVAILVIGIITSNLHSYSIQKNLIQEVEEEIDSVKLTFKDITKSMRASLRFLYSDGGETMEIETEYYINRKTNSLYREPYVDYGFFRDVYVSPVEYKSGLEGRGEIILLKGEEKEIQDLKIKFIGFEINKQHMKAGTPELFAKLSVNSMGKNYFLKPGLKIINKDMKVPIDVKIPHTNRKISMMRFDIKHKKVLIFVDPGKDAPIQPDSAIVEVSFKRLIWLVWLGTILISFGSFFAIRRSLEKQ